MDDNLNILIDLLKKHAKAESVQALVQWDQETYMPEGAGEFKSEQLAWLSALVHEMHTGEPFKKVLEKVVNLYTGDVLNSNADKEEKRLLYLIWKDYHYASVLPRSFVEDFSFLTSQSQQVWAKARANNDFKLFLPYLEKIVDMCKKQADYYGYKTTPYDALMEQYEPGVTTQQVESLFSELKSGLLELLDKIKNSNEKLDDHLLKESFDTAHQWAFGLEVIEKMGFDMTKGRQDRSAHPFTTGFHPTDVRITTRVYENDMKSAFFSTVHEAGHALYEQGLPVEHFGTPFGQAASYGIHESQSRLWENMIAKSLPFWHYFYPRLKEYFPILQKTSVEAFYKMINMVKPSLIRIDADEVTYSLHIMLRFEIEKMLINEELNVSELPDLWNAKMKEYFDLTPPDDKMGVMQDVHWSMGSIGYFPSYALGNLYAAQFLKKAVADIPGFWETIQMGEFAIFLQWLREKIHVQGRRYNPLDLVSSVTGQKLSPKPFLQYLNTKYHEIYKL
ncbi:MAG: carboxypeptidase M32 [Candidatus Marinimicrobia bacterium]|nr:carboxypeptidase M32 [Candidatus Neomarinimicrobiota bacterium]MDD5581748.1 carboxypeptidase M32 [Candidatus Neomarinimicrobiota bacterium]